MVRRLRLKPEDIIMGLDLAGEQHQAVCLVELFLPFIGQVFDGPGDERRDAETDQIPGGP